MTAGQFLESLTAKGVELFLEDGRLRYRAPDGVVDGALLAQIRERRSDLIEHLETSELSPGEAALWFLYELDRENTAYNTFYAARLTHGLDAAVLKHALDDLHHRHSALRSRFGTIEGKAIRHA